MNFRFAHYDPPKKKVPKPKPKSTPTTANANTSANATVTTRGRAKVPVRTSKVVLQKRQSVSAPTPVPTQQDENETEKKDSKSSSPATFRRSSTQTSDASSTTSFFTSNTTISTPTSSNLTPSSISTMMPPTSATPSSLLIPSYPEPPEPSVETNAVLDTYLPQGRLDPFKIFPVENVPIYVQEIIDHALINKWHLISPSDPTQTRRAWLHCALSSPVAFYALAFAASQHLNYLRYGAEPPQTALLRLSYKTEAAKLINRALTRLNGGYIPDSLLIAILSLGAHGHKPVRHSEDRGEGGGGGSRGEEEKLRGPKSPLASAQMLDFYGHIDQETAHMSALRILLAHNKGVERIQLAGLRGALALGDMLHSTITHLKPSLHTTTPVREIAGVAQFLQQCLAANGNGMNEVAFPIRTASLPLTKPARKLLQTITHARAVTMALDHLVHPPQNTNSTGIPVTVTEIDLTLARNDVHHALISLQTANPLWDAPAALYESVRITALIYSDLVLFPLPQETGVRGRYARMLRARLSCDNIAGVWREEAGVLGWCCVLGAVAAADVRPAKLVVRNELGEKVVVEGQREEWREERRWFIDRVRVCAEMLGVELARGMEGWGDVREKMCKRFLWWDDVCDVVGRGVWEEAVAMQMGEMGWGTY